MSRENKLYIRKSDTGTTYNSLDDFGFAASEIPWPEEEFKDVAVRDWPGEDGEDAYIPPKLMIKPYDLKVKFVYKGARGSAYADYVRFRNFLSGRDGAGATLRIYDARTGIGRRNVYCKSIPTPDFKRDNLNDYASMEVKFRVTDPSADVTLPTKE